MARSSEQFNRAVAGDILRLAHDTGNFQIGDLFFEEKK